MAAVHGPGDEERREAVVDEQVHAGSSARHPAVARAIRADPCEPAARKVEEEVERGWQFRHLGQRGNQARNFVGVEALLDAVLFEDAPPEFDTRVELRR